MAQIRPEDITHSSASVPHHGHTNTAQHPPHHTPETTSMSSLNSSANPVSSGQRAFEPRNLDRPVPSFPPPRPFVANSVGVSRSKTLIMDNSPLDQSRSLASSRSMHFIRPTDHDNTPLVTCNRIGVPSFNPAVPQHMRPPPGHEAASHTSPLQGPTDHNPIGTQHTQGPSPGHPYGTIMQHRPASKNGYQSTFTPSFAMQHHLRPTIPHQHSAPSRSSFNPREHVQPSPHPPRGAPANPTSYQAQPPPLRRTQTQHPLAVSNRPALRRLASVHPSSLGASTIYPFSAIGTQALRRQDGLSLTPSSDEGSLHPISLHSESPSHKALSRPQDREASLYQAEYKPSGSLRPFTDDNEGGNNVGYEPADGDTTMEGDEAINDLYHQGDTTFDSETTYINGDEDYDDDESFDTTFKSDTFDYDDDKFMQYEDGPVQDQFIEYTSYTDYAEEEDDEGLEQYYDDHGHANDNTVGPRQEEPINKWTPVTQDDRYVNDQVEDPSSIGGQRDENSDGSDPNAISGQVAYAASTPVGKPHSLPAQPHEPPLSDAQSSRAVDVPEKHAGPALQSTIGKQAENEEVPDDDHPMVETEAAAEDTSIEVDVEAEKSGEKLDDIAETEQWKVGKRPGHQGSHVKRADSGSQEKRGEKRPSSESISTSAERVLKKPFRPLKITLAKVKPQDKPAPPKPPKFTPLKPSSSSNSQLGSDDDIKSSDPSTGLAPFPLASTPSSKSSRRTQKSAKLHQPFKTPTRKTDPLDPSSASSPTSEFTGARSSGTTKPRRATGGGVSLAPAKPVSNQARSAQAEKAQVTKLENKIRMLEEALRYIDHEDKEQDTLADTEKWQSAGRDVAEKLFTRMQQPEEMLSGGDAGPFQNMGFSGWGYDNGPTTPAQMGYGGFGAGMRPQTQVYAPTYRPLTDEQKEFLDKAERNADGDVVDAEGNPVMVPDEGAMEEAMAEAAKGSGKVASGLYVSPFNSEESAPFSSDPIRAETHRMGELVDRVEAEWNVGMMLRMMKLDPMTLGWNDRQGDWDE